MATENKVLMIVALFAAGSLVAVFAIVWTLPDVTRELQAKHICLPDKEHREKLKCEHSAVILKVYLTRIVHTAYTNKRNEEISKKQTAAAQAIALKQSHEDYQIETMPVAKVTGIDQPELIEGDVDAEMVPIRSWRSGRSLGDVGGFLRYGVTCRNGRLVVPVTGIYFTYSFVDFYEDCSPANGKPVVRDINTPLKHALYTYSVNVGKEQELISSVQPHKISSNQNFNNYGSYISSLVTLQAGDEVSVKVSNITSLKYTRENYFGINLISSV